jgi:hypothetical protein
MPSSDGALQVLHWISLEIVTLQPNWAGIANLFEHLEKASHVVVAFIQWTNQLIPVTAPIRAVDGNKKQMRRAGFDNGFQPISISGCQFMTQIHSHTHIRAIHFLNDSQCIIGLGHEIPFVWVKRDPQACHASGIGDVSHDAHGVFVVGGFRESWADRDPCG